MKSKINFSYIGCSKESLEAKEASFNESQFEDELEKSFETSINVTNINFEIKENSSQKTERFVVTIIVKSPDGTFDISEKGNDAAKVSRDAIKSVIRNIHKLKEKKVNDFQ
jgi:ribosome-associated translation inhibitor RaiA